jgi:hypothetical protein
MAKPNGMWNGESHATLAESLGSGPEQVPGEPTAPESEHSLWIPEGRAERRPELELVVEPVSSLARPEPAASLREGLTAAEERAHRIAEEVARVQSELRLTLDAGLAEAAQAARSRSRLALPRMSTQLVVGLLFVLAVSFSWKVGLLSTGSGENLVLDSGFESTPLRWRPAGLQSDISGAHGLGVGGSAALEVRTRGSKDGEGVAYFQSDGVRSGKPETFSAFVRGVHRAAVYPEIRWRATDGSLIQASRGQVTIVDQSWKRIDVSGTTPDGATSALLVVGEAAGTSKPVAYLLDDVQLERTTTPGSYVETGDETGGRPSHLTDVGALFILLAAGFLAFTYLRAAVLVVLPLSLAIPPSLASFDSYLPDMTLTRALVFCCMAAAIARGMLRAPRPVLLALGAAYAAVVLIALVGDPSVVSVRLALSLTIGAFAPALLVLAVARERRDLWMLAGSLAATSVAVAAVAVAEWHFQRHWIPLYPGVIFDALERGDHLRARATFPHPIALGTFLAMAMPLALGMVLATRGLRRVAVGAGGILMVAGLAVTLSRAPWLGALVGLMAFAVLSGAWRRWKPIAAAIVVSAVLVASPLGMPVREAAAGLVRPQTTQERFVVQVRVDLARQIGGDGIRRLVSSSLDPADRPAFPAVIQGRQVDLGQSIDNTYVRELAQTGLLGLLIMVALLIGVNVETIRGALRERGSLRYLGSGLAAAQLVVLLVGLTVGTISFSQVGTAFWLVAGAGIATRQLSEHGSDLH